MTLDTNDRLKSASAQVILEQLKRLKMTKTEFAQRLGVSQDYVYRILNGRIAFPHARETIEKMAEAIGVDPYIFAEYRQLDENLSISTRLVWQRMKELGMSREDLYQAMGGRISRPYFNSILRGDQPFPTNRAYIQMFAMALELPPPAFVEFGPKQAPRWSEKDMRETEEKTFQFFFDKMMADRGYLPHAMPLEVLDERKVAAFFLSPEAMHPALGAVLNRMAELAMGYKELEKVSGVPPERLRALFTVEGHADTADGDIRTIERALHMSDR